MDQKLAKADGGTASLDAVLRGCRGEKKGAKPPPAKPVAAAAQPTRPSPTTKPTWTTPPTRTPRRWRSTKARDVLDSTDNAELASHYRESVAANEEHQHRFW